MRQPIVAGQFYESDPEKLKKQLKEFFDSVPPDIKSNKLLAAIVPHAGYVYSGKCAAYFYKLLSQKKLPELFIILGVNHSSTSDKALISIEDWKTPLGIIKVDKESAFKLESDFIKIDENSHKYEHSIEVQLPFLQFITNKIKILPIILSNLDLDLAKKIAEKIFSIKKDFIVIVSSDFIHYGLNYNYTPFDSISEVKKLEQDIFDSICKLDSKKFISLIEKNQATVCGASSILVLLELLKKLSSKKGKLICSYNSGDIVHDYTNFVDYASIIFEK